MLQTRTVGRGADDEAPAENGAPADVGLPVDEGVLAPVAGQGVDAEGADDEGAADDASDGRIRCCTDAGIRGDRSTAATPGSKARRSDIDRFCVKGSPVR